MRELRNGSLQETFPMEGQGRIGFSRAGPVRSFQEGQKLQTTQTRSVSDTSPKGEWVSMLIQLLQIHI